MIPLLLRMMSVYLLCIFCVAAFAKQPPLYFHSLNNANGLSHNKVNCILQDSRGFIWIGTDDGLNRYDGNQFFIYKNIPGNTSSISGNTIKDLHEDKAGILWIATADGGISKYDYRQSPEKQFKQYKHNPPDENSIPVNLINAIAEDNNGILWLATGGAALLKFDKKTESFHRLASAGNWTINDLCFDKDKILWAGREGGSILKLNTNTEDWWIDERYNDFYAKLPHVVVTTLYKDRFDHIWFGSWDKAVYRHNNFSRKEEVFTAGGQNSFGNDEATSFAEDNQGRLWIGSKHSGLYIYNHNTGDFYNYPYEGSREGGISKGKVNTIYRDQTGRIWVGTDNGISFYHPAKQRFEQKFIPVSYFQELTIYDFYQNNDELWLGTNRGLFIEKNGRFEHLPLSYKGSSISLTKIYRSKNGTMYLGTDYTLFVFNQHKRTIEPLQNSDKDEVMGKLIESRVVSISEDIIDGNPVIWSIPYGHYISYYDLNANYWVSRKDSIKKIIEKYNLKDNLIRKIHVTKNGSIWFGTAKKGLIHFNKKTGKSTYYYNNPSDPASISNNNIYDFIEDQNGNFWISTYGGGLNYFDLKSRKFTHFSSTNNLLEGIEIDDKGNIWTITNGSLQKFDIIRKTFSLFDLPDIEKTNGVRGIIFKDKEGLFYVAGTGYYIKLNPLELNPVIEKLKVYLTDFVIFNKSHSDLLYSKSAKLNHKQNFFSIHFSAPSFEQHGVQYAYKLEGVDADWNYSGSSTQAYYTNLSAGTYTFRVKATTTPGMWSETEAMMTIMIVPPFWKTWWFYLLSVLAVLSIGYILYKYRITELLKRQAIRNRIAQDLHDQVGSTLSSISVYSQVAKIYKEKNRNEELQSTLEKISSTSGEMITEMGDIVWAISPKNDHIGTIINRMESYAKPLLNTQGIKSSFTYPEDIKNIYLYMEKRKNFYLVFKEAINNAIKYGHCRNLSVDITRKANLIIMKIEDDGSGFNLNEALSKEGQSLGGNGIRNMHQRAKDMSGNLKIISKPGLGTIIKLEFPIK